MTNPSLLRLMTLLSPTFPVGGFAYSAGLETACQQGLVCDQTQLADWIETSLTRGSLRNDGILLSAAAAATGPSDEVETEGPPLEMINDLALSLCGSATRYKEIITIGGSFIEAAAPWIETEDLNLPDPIAYPVAVGVVTAIACKDLSTKSALAAYYQASVSQQLQAALRLMALGQQAAVALQQRFESVILECAELASRSPLDALGTSALIMDVAAMQHSTLNSRIFRS